MLLLNKNIDFSKRLIVSRVSRTAVSLLSNTGRAAVQHGSDTVTEQRRQNGEKVVWSQLGQRIACPPPSPPPPHLCNFTFKPSTSTRPPLLLKATGKHAAVLSSLAWIRGKNKTLNVLVHFDWRQPCSCREDEGSLATATLLIIAHCQHNISWCLIVHYTTVTLMFL